MRHVRQAKLCASGAREFFKKQGWDWMDFLRHGIPVETAEATGDAFALKVAACARAEK